MIAYAVVVDRLLALSYLSVLQVQQFFGFPCFESRLLFLNFCYCFYVIGRVVGL